eukprot:9602315-Alexandrium_andersonii.AAC.1
MALRRATTWKRRALCARAVSCWACSPGPSTTRISRHAGRLSTVIAAQPPWAKSARGRAGAQASPRTSSP